MSFYSYNFRCRSSNITPEKAGLMKHIKEATELCTKCHPNSQIAIALKNKPELKPFLVLASAPSVQNINQTSKTWYTIPTIVIHCMT